MADVRIRINYTSGLAALGSLSCIAMRSTGGAGDGIGQGDYVTLNDGGKVRTFMFDPNISIPDIAGSTIPVRVDYGATGEKVRDVLYDAIRNSDINIIPSKDADKNITLANAKGSTSGNVTISESITGITGGTLGPIGMSGGTDSSGNSAFLTKTPRELKSIVIPLGANGGRQGALSLIRHCGTIGGVCVYADLNGCIIKGDIFERLARSSYGDIVNNILAHTEGATVDSTIIVETISSTKVGFTGGMPPSLIAGFTGGVGN